MPGSHLPPPPAADWSHLPPPPDLPPQIQPAPRFTIGTGGAVVIVLLALAAPFVIGFLLLWGLSLAWSTGSC